MIDRLKKWVKSRKGVRRIGLWAMRVLAPVFQVINILAFPRYVTFLYDWRRYVHAGGKAKILDFYPCLNDKTSTIPFDTHYFYQAIWAFKRILKAGVKEHFDVASDIRFVGLLTTITNVTYVDIRPLDLKLEGLKCQSGSIVSLPFASRSIESLSCKHVIEHVGLGRYGDPIDPDGPAKGCKELARVLAAGGRMYISVPIGEPKVQFNGQRVFSVQEIIEMFGELELKEFSIVDTDGSFKENIDRGAGLTQDTGQDFGLGLFVFSRP